VPRFGVYVTLFVVRCRAGGQNHNTTPWLPSFLLVGRERGGQECLDLLVVVLSSDAILALWPQPVAPSPLVPRASPKNFRAASPSITPFGTDSIRHRPGVQFVAVGRVGYVVVAKQTEQPRSRLVGTHRRLSTPPRSETPDLGRGGGGWRWRSAWRRRRVCLDTPDTVACRTQVGLTRDARGRPSARPKPLPPPSALRATTAQACNVGLTPLQGDRRRPLWPMACRDLCCLHRLGPGPAWCQAPLLTHHPWIYALRNLPARTVSCLTHTAVVTGVSSGCQRIASWVWMCGSQSTTRRLSDTWRVA